MGLLRCFTRHISRPNLPAPRAKRAHQTPCVGQPLSPEVIASVEESRRSLEAMRTAYPEFAHSEPYRLPETAENSSPRTHVPTAPPTPTRSVPNVTPPRQRARTPLIIRGPQRTSPESMSMPVLPRTHYEPASRLNRRSNETATPRQRTFTSSSLLQRAKAWTKRNNGRARVERSSSLKGAFTHGRRLRRDNRFEDDSTTQTMTPPQRRRERRTSMDVAVLRRLSDMATKRRGSDVSPRSASTRSEDISPLRRSFEMARKSIENARKSMERRTNRMVVNPVPSNLPPPRPASYQPVEEPEQSEQESIPQKEDLDGVESNTEEEEIDVVSLKQDDFPSMDSCTVSYAPGQEENCSMMSDYPVSLDILRVSRTSFGYERVADEPSLNRRDEMCDSQATADRYSYGFERQEKRRSQDRPSFGASMNSFDMCESSPSAMGDDIVYDDVEDSRRYEDSDMNYAHGSDDEYRTARGGFEEDHDEYRSVVRSISSELTASSSSEEAAAPRAKYPPPKSMRIRRTDSAVALPPRRRADRITNSLSRAPVPPTRPCIPVRLAVEPKLRERYAR